MTPKGISWRKEKKNQINAEVIQIICLTMFSYLIQLIWFWNFLQCCRWHSPTVGSRMPDLLLLKLLNMPIVCSHICYDIVASSGRIRIWIHPSAIVYPVQSPVLCRHSPLSTLHLTQSQPDCGLICAVHSSMPDKSMCQHLFLCCQFFMVFDDISPIVRPTCVVRWDPSPSRSPPYGLLATNIKQSLTSFGGHVYPFG